MKIKASFSVLIVLSFVLLFTASQAYAAYGSTTSTSTNDNSTPSCNADTPEAPVLYEPNHFLLPRATGVGEVRLNWLKAARATKYTIGFGISPSNYIYGLSDVGDTDHFTVQFLTPGKRYYFAVKGVNGCKPGDWSREWAVIIGRGTGRSYTSFGTSAPQVVTPPNNTQPNILPQNPPQPPVGGQPGYNPPLPTAPRLGFFQGLWRGFIGLFGVK